MNYTKIFRSNLVLDTDVGTRQQTEQFYPLTRGRLDRINRDNVGFTRRSVPSRAEPAQCHPEGDVRRRRLPNLPGFTFDNRLVDQGEAWLTSMRSNLTWIKGSHSFKGGLLSRAVAQLRRERRRRRRPVGRTVQLHRRRQQPGRHELHLRQRAARAFRDYTEIDAFSEVKGKRLMSEFYVQDTWRATQRLTLDYGVRFLWYKPWYSTQPAAVFVPERYDPAQRAAALSAGAGQQRERRA